MGMNPCRDRGPDLVAPSEYLDTEHRVLNAKSGQIGYGLCCKHSRRAQLLLAIPDLVMPAVIRQGRSTQP